MSGSLGLALPVLAAWVWLRSTDRVGSTRPALTAALAYAIGIGASSLTTFAFVLGDLPLGSRFVVFDALLWTALAAAGLWRLRTTGHRLTSAKRPSGVDAIPSWIARLAVAVVVALAAGTALREYSLSVHGEWDAWAIWNQKARFLMRGGTHWTDVLTIEWSNPSHPLLVPLTVARLWAYAGAEATFWPAAIAALFGVAAVAVVTGMLEGRRDSTWLAAATVLAPGLFIQQAMTQQADVPVGLFMAASAAALLEAEKAFFDDRRRARNWLLLAGTLAAFAAWTKNEGLLFAAATLPALTWISVHHRAYASPAWYAIGAAPMGLAWAWFKYDMAPVSPLYFDGPQSLSSVVQRLLEAEHGGIVAGAIAREIGSWGGPWAGGAFAVMLATSTILATRSRPAGLVMSVVLCMLIGHYCVFQLTPFDPLWLVQVTFYRLLTQLWPLIVVATFIGIQRLGRTARQAQTDLA